MLEPNHHTTTFFSENLLAIEMKTTQILMNKTAFLGSSILELGKIIIVMYKFWYDYVKLKYKEKVKLF